MANDKHITRSVGVNHVVRELSLVGWNVKPAGRNAEGAHLYVSSADERTIHPVKVRTHGRKPEDTSLGVDPERLVTPWWIIVSYALTPEITCYVLSLDELRQLSTRDSGVRTKKPEEERLLWLHRQYYSLGSYQELIEARNAWHRLGLPRSAA